MSNEIKNNELEKKIEFGIGIIGIVGGFIWRLIIASASDETMRQWARVRKAYRMGTMV